MSQVLSEHLLEPSLRKRVLSLVRGAGFEESQFAWEEQLSSVASHVKVSVLVHRETGHYFKFDFRAHHHHAIFTSGRNSSVEEVRTETWGRQFTTVRIWADALAQAVAAPLALDAPAVPGAAELSPPAA